ncbi:integrase catalytic domain-containing protein [Trichonephila clavata]|uniref:Integrase catalytic domain-containing protein n=1 Tax=Trichonephila clavata TaxID=2740835 RepID=A0A8X6LT06_TRICU|nr:integrase catalytic domain-containing protein [Trichonephila clavata]
MKNSPTAPPMLNINLYMDDFVASVETKPQIITLHREITDLMLLIKIPMHKWATNSLLLQNLLRTQDTWVLGISWDELFPPNLATLGYAVVKELDNIHSIQILRFIGISSYIPCAVHVFCYESEHAYGSVLYIVTVKGNQSNVHLVCSRNRLTPIRKVTLSRVELLAALMGARLLRYFCA